MKKRSIIAIFLITLLNPALCVSNTPNEKYETFKIFFELMEVEKQYKLAQSFMVNEMSKLCN